MADKYERGLSIVMPCLNESKTLKICIEKAFTSIKKLKINGEVIIADNGSNDGSQKIAKECGAKVVNVKEKGYGSALRGGIAKAKYEYVIMGDADDSYDFLDLKGFIEKLDEGYELVMGNRFKGGIEKGAMPFSHQYIGNPVLSGIGRLFFKTDIGDFHCGLRAFRKDAIERLNLCTTGMEFASEMVVKSVLFNLKITEVPTKLYPDGRDRPPHLRSIPDGLRHLEFLLIYSPKWLFVYPGIIFSVIGALLVLIISFNPIQIGKVQFEITTMLYGAIMLLIGLQMLQFSVYTNIYGERIGQLPGNNTSIDKVKEFVNKKGYFVSTLIIIIGLIGIIYTLIEWGNLNFGQVNSTSIARTAMLFGTLFAIGFEGLLFTLFVRILQLGVKK